MTVYVDNFRAKYGRMIMCHMMADDLDELHEMADAIGVARKWFQGDHYDICLAKRALAVQQGAHEVTTRQLVLQRQEHRKRVALAKGLKKALPSDWNHGRP